MSTDRDIAKELGITPAQLREEMDTPNALHIDTIESLLKQIRNGSFEAADIEESPGRRISRLLNARSLAYELYVAFRDADIVVS